MKTLLMVLVCLFVTGCATSKPVLPDAYYSQNSRYFATFTRCHEVGLLSTELAAIANSDFKSTMAGYTYDAARFNNEVASLYKTGATPSQNVCSQIAVNMTEKKQQREFNSRNSDGVIQSNQAVFNNLQPKQTYCNKIGNQMFCNSY